MPDPLFNVNEYSIANCIINQANHFEISLSNIKLNSIILLLDGWAQTKYQKQLCQYQQYFLAGQFSVILPKIHQHFKSYLGSINTAIVDPSFKNGKLIIKHYPKLDTNNPHFNDFKEMSRILLFSKCASTIKDQLAKLNKSDLAKLDKCEVQQIYNNCSLSIFTQGKCLYEQYLDLKQLGYSPAFINDPATEKLRQELIKTTANLSRTQTKTIIKLVNWAYQLGQTK